MNQTFLAGTIFLITYALIISERVHRTIAALLGGFVVILLGILSQEKAFQAIDFNVIFLLCGMMIIAYILGETGLFQWIAIQAIKLGQHNPFRIMMMLALVTAVTSALLDNVTVVVLIAPVTLFVASNLHISPLPFLICEVLASNIGGTSTLIGDPPNILIGSAASIDFVPFVTNMVSPVIIILVAFIPLSYLVFRQDLIPQDEGRPRVSKLDTGQLIADRTLLVKSLLVIAGVLIGFILHGFLHLEPATIAMSGAAILMLISGKDPLQVLEHVEWITLFFFIGLFITIEAIVKVGIVKMIAEQTLILTSGNLPLTAIFVLWLSAVVSAVVDNIPYTATMIPLIKELGQAGMNTGPLWWALVLGADLGGNFTIVGASANVVVASLSERSGYHISFAHFLKKSFLITFISILIATAYLWLFYL
jgi:Na+/H+ antiporter NhaD/arsenite permease-like protein